MNFLKKLCAVLAFAPALAMAAGSNFPLDTAPERTSLASLQNGAKLFVNHCLNCHAASSMRYNRLKDLGLTEDQIKLNLLFSAEKVGELMNISMSPKDAKTWFGGVPPDLSVIARAKSSHAGTGADYLYTYLRTFYKDDSRPTGWNNMAFPNIGMPHVLWELQGVQTAKFVEVDDAHEKDEKTGKPKKVHKFEKFEQVTPGKMSKAEFDEAMADLVGYLNWMAEPAQVKRKAIGPWVVMFMSLLTLFAWALNASYWKEVK
ncbi:cytochrome c1 [Massilia sp. W12]|uniref:cytochrome c1 n=1 Tax=Massilia sp. W12 TaxID=3126507 RepID=UPI0030CD9628